MVYVYNLNNLDLIANFFAENIMTRLVFSAYCPHRNMPEYLCWSSSLSSGVFSVLDVKKMGIVAQDVYAHKSQILKLALNYQSNLLATMSCGGSQIKIWKLPSVECIQVLSRGLFSDTSPI
jgi:WD40 repeat protein